MTRRLVSTLGALAAGLLLAVAAPGSAHAETGEIVINGTDYASSSPGCVSFDFETELDIDNNSDQTVVVYRDPDCNDGVVGTVHPGFREVFHGASVYIY